MTGPTKGGPPRQQQVRITPDMLRDINCDACGNHTFQAVVFLKRVPALLSPTSEEALVPMEVFACVACGNVNKEFLKNIPFEKKDELSKPELSSPAAPAEQAPSADKPNLVLIDGYKK